MNSRRFSGPDDPGLHVRLTPRETDVLKWVARGKTNWEIANIMAVTEATIKEHVGNICRKFGVKTRAHAVSLAIWHGYIAL
jgi:LuxR family quorum sensing-dependent transcriptional regulator